MKNEIKVIDALQKAFIGKETASVYNPITNMYDIYIDNKFVGAFKHDFFIHDFDNHEIEIKVKARLKDFINFIDNTYKGETIASGISEGIIRHAIEKGVREWEEESQYKAESED